MRITADVGVAFAPGGAGVRATDRDALRFTRTFSSGGCDGVYQTPRLLRATESRRSRFLRARLDGHGGNRERNTESPSVASRRDMQDCISRFGAHRVSLAPGKQFRGDAARACNGCVPLGVARE